MMENKQLNLSRPLLSVRRHTSTVASENDYKKNTIGSLSSIPRPPPYKSELKSGPVRNAGTVPFVWEKSPGRPKDERINQTHAERLPAAPKLPPGRVLKANQQENDNASENLTVNKSQVGNRLGSQNVSELDEYSTRLECAEDAVEEAEDEKSDSGDDDEVYEDALDTLSRTESFFLNCSVSGISGLDNSDVNPSGTFFTDPQAREFMIGRFLPAAKAMVSETPQYAPSPKKQPVVQDNPRQLKKVLNADKRPQLRYGPSFAKHYSEFHDNGEEESDDDYAEHGSLSTKVCGLLPRFCLKSRLLNPLPGVSVRTRTPMSPATTLQARSSSASTCSKTENELSSVDMSEQRSIDGSQTTELHEEKNDLNNKSGQISLKSQKFGLSANRHNGLSSYYNGSYASIDQRAFQPIPVEAQDARVDGFSYGEKNYRSFRDLLADQSTSDEVCAGSPAVEKTLYIDTVHNGEAPKEETCSFDIMVQSNLKAKDDKSFTKIVDKNISDDSSVVDKLSIVDGGDTLPNNFQEPLDFSLLSLADEPGQKVEKDAPKPFGEDQNHYQDAVDSKNLELPVKQITQSFGKQIPKAEKVTNFHGIYVECPVPPPLPKSPSDSWLGRTLPSMSSKNSSILSHHGTGIHPINQVSKTQFSDPKWETVVKTTKVHHHHLRYSEELLAPIPES